MKKYTLIPFVVFTLLFSSMRIAHANEVSLGVVTSAVTKSKVTGTSNYGAYTGLGVGAYLSYTLIKSNNLLLMAGGVVVGALAGGAIGHQVDNQINQSSYQELTVRLQNGQEVFVITDPSMFGRNYAVSDAVTVTINELGLAKIRR